MDQNIVLIITNVIVLVAALGASAIGALLTNRYSLGQENRRKKREVIEELYGLIFKVRIKVDAYLLGGPSSELSGDAPDFLLRMVVLTDLYFKPYTAKVLEFSSRIKSVEDAHKRQYNAQDDYGSAIKGNTDEFDQAKEEYMRSYAKLTETLQELAKGSTDII